MLLCVTSCDLISNLRGSGANNDDNKDNGNTGDDGWVMPED